jgi:hypothetical protein
MEFSKKGGGVQPFHIFIFKTKVFKMALNMEKHEDKNVSICAIFN